MPARLGAVLCVASLSAMSAFATPKYPIYPKDVDTFIERVGLCEEASSQHLVLPEKFWACDKLAADRAALLARYHGQPEIITALNGQWHQVVARVPPHDISPDDIIQGACDVAIDLRDDLKKQKQPTKAVMQDAEVLHGLLCPNDHPNQNAPQKKL